MSTLPHRFRESAFRTYEDSIAKAVLVYPEVHVFNPGDLSTVTYTCRMRDAMRSLLEHGWHTKQVDLVKFSECYKLLQISEDDGKVLTGSRDKIRGYRIANRVMDSNTSLLGDAKEVKDYTVANLDEAKVLCQYCEKGLLRPVRLFGINSDTANWLMNNFDVLLEPSNAGFVLK